MSKIAPRQLVELFIKKHNKDFKSSSHRLAYERGLLTGLLTNLAHDDTYVYNYILKKLDLDENKK